MRTRASIATLAATLCFAVAAAPARAGEKGASRAQVVLNGEKVDVRWSDGDSFRFLSGPYADSGTRLRGFNALESFGPVHRWGDWKPEELYDIAHGMAKLARAQTWECTTKGEKDGYGRVLVECPGLAREFVKQGLALVFAVDEKPDPEMLKLQQEAREKKLGMWAKGTPAEIITSVHSASEKGHSYNRVVDARTGEALERAHSQDYATCEEVCVGEGANRSCMVYVPFERRYKDRPPCLRKGKGHE